MKKILIIDDDQRNIFALKATLKQKGFVCLDATYAEDGINILEKERDIAAILLDMMMPDIDGYELIGIIRNKERFEKIPIIAVTARAMPGDREKCLQSGADEYISKPIDVDVMFTILDHYTK
jgi:two-component system, cell cycle response regulator DivK